MPEVTPAPIVWSICPDCGYVGQTVSITNLWGDNFQAGATARITDGITSTDLISVTVVSANQITGVLDLSTLPSGEMVESYDVQVTNPDGQSGMAEHKKFQVFPNPEGGCFHLDWPVKATCNSSVISCTNAIELDFNVAQIEEGGVITADFGPCDGIVDLVDSAYFDSPFDFGFFEKYDAPDDNGFRLGSIVIELSQDQQTWYEVFHWGDGYTESPTCTVNSIACDDFTNIAFWSNDGNGEVDGEVIYAPEPIVIDISFLSDFPDPPPDDARYRYVRLSRPYPGCCAEVDAIWEPHMNCCAIREQGVE
jgi:hypothetical protein